PRSPRGSRGSPRGRGARARASSGPPSRRRTTIRDRTSAGGSSPDALIDALDRLHRALRAEPLLGAGPARAAHRAAAPRIAQDGLQRARDALRPIVVDQKSGLAV